MKTAPLGWPARRPRFPALLALVAIVALGVLALAVAGCSSTSTTTTAAGTTASTAAPGVKTGGVLKVGTAAATNLDPAFSTSQPDILLNQQLYDYLVGVDEANQIVPALATKWQVSNDGLTWTFDVRPDVTFSNGTPLTSADVVSTFNRLRDPKVGAPTVSLYKEIKSVSAPSATQVQFVLTAPNPEFAADVADYHAAILSKSVADPKKTQLGSGPFTLKSYQADNQAVLVKNPTYWMKDKDGRQLPYLDEVDFIFGPDQGAQVQALQSGELDFVPGLTAQLADQVKTASNLKLLENISNMHWVIHMRSDSGHVTSDNRVRQALKLGTDNQAMIDAVRPGLADVGNDTPVGPIFKDYYLDLAPVTNVDQAKKLLADAGKTGLTLTLVAQNAGDVPSIATVWKAQMAKIGVNVNIQTVPVDVYYGEGDQSWLKADFSITDWGTRATPVQYFKDAYVTGASYNESHWSDPEFDQLTKQIGSELDPAKRAALYKQAQQILMERGPVIVPYMVKPVAGINASVEGVVLASDWPRTAFRTASLTK